MKRALVTGAAGFIGFHLTKRLLEMGFFVVGMDNLNTYYDVSLKEKRLSILKESAGFHFVFGDIADRQLVRETMASEPFDLVVHLAAQAGVRHSLTHPEEYIQTNLVGFFNVIDAAKKFAVPHFMYASSSSVYGNKKILPFSEEDRVDTPISLYAATKKSDELLAHSYSDMYGLKTTGFRFFSAYGPYGRPDMALFLFTKNTLTGKPIQLFNHGDMRRDFTYIDDIVGGIAALMERSTVLFGEKGKYEVYNIGNGNPIALREFVSLIEKEAGRAAIIEYEPMQPGDIKEAYADVSKLKRDTGFSPKTSVEEGVGAFVRWFRWYYGL